MFKKVEHILNYAVGLILINGLYLFSGLTRIPMAFTLMLCLLVSAFYLVINFNKNRFVSLLNNWFVAFYIVVSVLLSLVDFYFNDTTISPNDLIRAIIYGVYFSWTYNFILDQKIEKKWFVNIAIISIIILVFQGILENSIPLAFSFLLSENVEKRVVGRIAGTLIDSNSYAGLLTIYFIILYNDYLKPRLKYILAVIIGVVLLYFVELAGSRQAMLMFAVFLFSLYIKNISFKRIFYTVGFFVVAGLLVLAFWGKLTQYAISNPFSSVSRIIASSDNPQAVKSNFERNRSLVSGFELLKDNYFIYGPGSLNFKSRWASFSEAAEPHNGLLFWLVQYGVFTVFVLILYYKYFKRSIHTNQLVMFLAFTIHFLLQPNLMYYATMFFCIFYTDVIYNNKNLIGEGSDE